MSIYEAMLRERIELYVEEIEKEIDENNKMIKKYEKMSSSKVEVLEYFKDRLSKIKREFEIAKKVFENL